MISQKSSDAGDKLSGGGDTLRSTLANTYKSRDTKSILKTKVDAGNTARTSKVDFKSDSNEGESTVAVLPEE